MDKCFYCQKDTDVEAFRNPYTNEIHPTCEQCKLSFTVFHKERSLFAKLGCIWIPIFILISIIVTFYNFKLGLFLLVAGAILEFIVFKLQEYFVKKKDIAYGTYVDPKKIQWCKTCMYFRKIKNYDNTINGIWRCEQLPEKNLIPCKIIEDDLDIWRDFFSLDKDKKTLYPKNCPKWKKH